MTGAGGILRVLACGSVDDGKSTLIGHLLYQNGNLYDDQVATLEQESARVGNGDGSMDYSLLLDGLTAEREQGITIDAAYRYLATAHRNFIVADTPGHESYTRNMATAASRCSAALILVDACQGVLSQTRRHALICALMGIRRLLFVVNKMDLAAWSEGTFRSVQDQCSRLTGELEHFGLPRAESLAVPVSALYGDNLVTPSPRMPWYDGPTVMEWLHAVTPDDDGMRHAPLRLPVQYVIKAPRSAGGWQKDADDGFRNGSGIFRAYAGTVVSGGLRCGAPVMVLPSGLRTRVRDLWCGDRRVGEAGAGMAVALTLDGEHDVIRGDMIVAENQPAELEHIFKVRLVWMGEQPLYTGRQYLFRGVAGTATADIIRIRDIIELSSYQRLAADHFSHNDIGEAELMLSRPIPFDPYAENRETGGFILMDRLTNTTVACGMILHPLRRSATLHRQFEEVGPAERAALKGQQPCVIWFTGLSGAGKSTIANCLERKLYSLGRHTMLLDGDNIRQGLNRDLGFTEAGRIENIRRIGEVAKLLTDAGLIVLTAFISPFRAEREMVREILPAGRFIEVHVSTPLAECERRDPKGLYRRARQGDIPNFTGIDSPYEPPLTPEIVLGTTARQAEECADSIVDYLRCRGLL
jgi:bifunctional enzyme CysN/CysC